ncbi:hypothetical protein Ddye_026633 [Dipteronia dyeriana]|uniref:Reverse transcriptase domain-containing protein n=1 Tax=Dipteronia dyeriana TaxID=168575 RepID=A0AAD9WQN2_9ROSI|nr:hypothetical protein Ddye_026633 [Dipteronia dyeriana]
MAKLTTLLVGKGTKIQRMLLKQIRYRAFHNGKGKKLQKPKRVLPWNIRGFRKMVKRRKVRKVMFEHKPAVCFIQESKMDSFERKVIRSIWGSLLERGIGMDAFGSAGGLISLWNEDFFHGKRYTKVCEDQLAKIKSYTIRDGWSLDLRHENVKERKSLEVIFSKEEAREALSSCNGNKAPEPDGFNLKFIKDNWDVIEGDFLQLLEDFHGDGTIVKVLNKTFIALIPKCVKQELVKDFRPISLKWVLMENRGIGWVAVFLHRPFRFLSMGVQLRSSGWKGAFVKMILSLFLFNVAVEGLSDLLQKVTGKEMVKMVILGNGDVYISHLQFAYDAILFIQPIMEYLSNVRRILRCFELASGLRLNFQKSSVVRVRNKGSGEEDWATIFRCAKGSLPFGYLGL